MLYKDKLFLFYEKIIDIVFKLPDIFMERGVLTSVKRFGEKNKEGEITIVTLKDGNEVKIKKDKIEMDKDDYKWSFSYMPLDISYLDYLVEWTIIKVKDNQTLLIINNIYYEQIEPSVIKQLTDKKNRIFSVIEEELKKQYP